MSDLAGLSKEEGTKTKDKTSEIKKYPYSSLLHPVRKDNIEISFSEKTLKQFNDSKQERTKVDLLFSSLSPEILKKLNCKKMKKQLAILINVVLYSYHIENCTILCFESRLEGKI